MVTSAASLDRLLRSGFKGRIIIPRDTQMPMVDDAGNPLYEIPVGSDVEIVGERGPLGSRPLLYANVGAPVGETKALFSITGSNVRIEGLHFRGPKDPSGHAIKAEYFNAIKVVEDADPDGPQDANNGRNVVIADNEFERWSGAAVKLEGEHGNKKLGDWEQGWKFLTRGDARLVRIERNYMHHNVMDGGGYGVSVAGGAYGYVAGNVFDTNRHAVAATGRAYSGYEARFNYVLQGGIKQGGFYNQHFDVHGTGKNDYGGDAGEWFKIANNTIRGEQGYYVVKSRAAFMLRGKPREGAYFDNNVAVHDDLDEAIDLKGSHGSTGIGEDHDDFNFHASGNKFDTDYTKEIAAGDFDGDGCNDVFVATGTGWFFSRAGTQPWEFLKGASTRTGDLGFADIDNDRVTDVVDQRPNGKLRYLKLGPGAAVSLPSSPVPVKDLRFGDFDGDGLTDIFYTRKGEWYVWYGSTHAWANVGTSSTPISEMLFGFFDDVPGTDVGAVRNAQWSYSSGATQPWARLNSKLRKSFKNTVAADFDGNGKTDIAFSDGSKWRYSADGRAPLALLRKGASALDRMITGRFSAPPTDPNAPIPAQVVAWNTKGLQLILWSGLGTGDAFGALSHQDMR